MKHRIHLLLLELMEDHDLHTRELFLRNGRPQLLDLVETDVLGQGRWHDILGFEISRSKDTGWFGALTFGSGSRIGTPDQQPRSTFEQAERDIALLAAALRFGMADEVSKQDEEVGVDFLLDGELFTLEWCDIRAETERAKAWARTAFPEVAGDDVRIDKIIGSCYREELDIVAERIQDPDLCDHEERALYTRLVTAVSILAGRGICAYECCAGRHGGPGSSGFPDQPGLGHSPG
jgi:hypothetical protein